LKKNLNTEKIWNWKIQIPKKKLSGLAYLLDLQHLVVVGSTGNRQGRHWLRSFRGICCNHCVGLPLKWKSGRDYCALMFVIVFVVISHLRHSSYLFDASTNREEAIHYLHIASSVRLSKVVSQQSTS
jgi:hypothetical protein